MKLPDNIRKQIETWYDIEWESLSLESAKKLADTVFRQYELAGGEDCVVLMLIFDPEGWEEDGHHFYCKAGSPNM